MRAVRFHGVGDLRVETIPEPAAPGPGMVILRVLAAGICGSDLHNYRTGRWVAALPVTPGHELAGEVVGTGEGVSHLAVGDLVIADSRVPCGDCAYCRRGRQNLCVRLGFVGEVCDGGFAEQVVLPARGLLVVPAGVSPEVAAMAEPLAVALHAVRRLAPEAGVPIVIAGGGPIGGLVALLLADGGFGPLYLIERNPSRAGLIGEVAGTMPIDLSPEAISALGARACVDATGAASVVGTLIEGVAPGSRIALVGIAHSSLALDLNLLVEREVDLVGCSAFRDELSEAVGLLPRLSHHLLRLAATPISLDEVPAAYDRLLRGDPERLKTLVRP